MGSFCDLNSFNFFLNVAGIFRYFHGVEISMIDNAVALISDDDRNSFVFRQYHDGEPVADACGVLEQ